MNVEEIKLKYMLDKAPYTAPYYLINGKKSSHTALISLARQLGLPTNIRGEGVLDWSKKVASGLKKVKGAGTIEAAKKFISMVKGPFKE